MAKGKEHKRAQRTRERRIQFETRAQAADHLDTAYLAYRMGNLTEAIALAEKALRLSPNSMKAHALLAETYFNRQRDYNRAAHHFQFLIEHQHEDRSLPYFLGTCYYETRQYQKARETFAKFLQREKGRALPAKWKSLKLDAKKLIELCDQALVREAWRAERLQKLNEKEAPKKPPPKQKPPTPVTEAPTPHPVEVEPRSIAISFTFAEDHLRERVTRSEYQTVEDYLLTRQYHQLTLVKEFEELLCLPLLHNVDHYWYQIETVKKVLKQCRGRTQSRQWRCSDSSCRWCCCG
jgi:tetratricopeptide (TPR) repeat protein